MGSFGFSRIFFCKSPPPSDFVPVGDRRGPKILSPPIKNLEKKPCEEPPVSLKTYWEIRSHSQSFDRQITPVLLGRVECFKYIFYKYVAENVLRTYIVNKFWQLDGCTRANRQIWSVKSWFGLISHITGRVGILARQRVIDPLFFSGRTSYNLNLPLRVHLDACIHNRVKISHGKSLTMSHFLSTKLSKYRVTCSKLAGELANYSKSYM